MSSWEQLPYRKLKGVNLELFATDPANPGELLQMWNKLCWLLALLRHVKRFPKVELPVVEKPWRKGYINGELRHSLSEASPQLSLRCSDLEILLSPLRRLRNVKHIEIKPPFEPKSKSIDTLVSEISLEPFGCQTGDETDMEDIMIAIGQDTWTAWFDRILDHLADPGARDACAERRRDWSSH